MISTDPLRNRCRKEAYQAACEYLVYMIEKDDKRIPLKEKLSLQKLQSMYLNKMTWGFSFLNPIYSCFDGTLYQRTPEDFLNVLFKSAGEGHRVSLSIVEEIQKILEAHGDILSHNKETSVPTSSRGSDGSSSYPALLAVGL